MNGLEYAVIVAIPFLLLGFGFARWWFVAAPAVFWTVEYIGRAQGWWGYEPGEFTALFTVILILVGTCATALGIVVRVLARRAVAERLL